MRKSTVFQGIAAFATGWAGFELYWGPFSTWLYDREDEATKLTDSIITIAAAARSRELTASEIGLLPILGQRLSRVRWSISSKRYRDKAERAITLTQPGPVEQLRRRHAAAS